MPRLLTVYRVMSYVTGVVLIALIFVAVPLNHFAGSPTASAVIGPLHGFLYALYVVVVLLLAYSRRWSVGRTLLVLVAGTIPFAAFVVERRIVTAERARAATGAETDRDRVVAGE